jgi:hypothetical protein
MKINLLRDDQVTKIPHQNKEKDVLRFDDTFSGGNDDFYFQQPVPPTEEFKKPRRKFRFWLFLLVFIICGLGAMFIINPQFTSDIFKNFGKNVASVWNKSVDRIETFWLHRKDNKVVYIEKPVEQLAQKVQEGESIVKKTVNEVKDQVVQEQAVIKIEKPIEKEVLKEETVEKILDSPPVYETIRDDLALSKRNIFAAEYVWSKLPGGMIMDKMTIADDKLSISLKSRFPMLIQSYSGVISQHKMFASIVESDPVKVDELTQIELSNDLPQPKAEDRPERIWDLDVEWFDDYLKIAGDNSDVMVSQKLGNTSKLEDGILVHDINIKVSGDRSSIMVFLQELQDIPASIAVRSINSIYDEADQSNMLEMGLVFYERE